MEGRVPLRPLLQMAAWHGEHCQSKNSKQETDQTVLTITKALTKTTNCTFRAKKVEGQNNKNFRHKACAPSTFIVVAVPLKTSVF